jgi:L-phenylalanine/L-methionine N-acetyltransferase
MADILIRALEPDDLAAASEIWNQPRVVWGTLQTPFTSMEARRKRFMDIAPGHSRLAAVIDGRVVGVAFLHPIEQPRRRHAATLGMGVHDAFAGRGAGRALMAAIVEIADRWHHFTRLELTVWSDNDRAVRLYERFGFEREGVHRRYAWRDGAWADALAMARLTD